MTPLRGVMSKKVEPGRSPWAALKMHCTWRRWTSPRGMHSLVPVRKQDWEICEVEHWLKILGLVQFGWLVNDEWRHRSFNVFVWDISRKWGVISREHVLFLQKFERNTKNVPTFFPLLLSTWICLRWFFYRFYNGKSPLNQDLGKYVWLFPSIEPANASLLPSKMFTV